MSRGGALVLLILLGAWMAPAHAQSGRLLDTASVTARDDHLDLAVDFTCRLRYRTHSPASEADELRVQLEIGPDCEMPPAAQFASERLLPADAAGLVRSLELQPALAGGAELIIRWNHIEHYVLAPATGMRGLRVRVLRSPAFRIAVEEPEEPGRYAVNLASSLEPFDEIALAKAATRLGAPVYVSRRSVDEQLWYRLRAGPFDSRQSAEKLLREARSTYPGAWLAIDDENTGEPPPAGESAAAAGAGTRAPGAESRPDAALDRLLAEAREAMRARRYDEATTRLTRILASEDYVRRIDAAELLGLARERKGQLAQAKSVYEDFLRRYPGTDAAGRVSQRLQALRMASLPGRRGSGGGAADAWSAFGNASQYYRRDNSQISSAGLSRNLTTQDAVFTNLDGLLRYRGEHRDLTARLSMGHQKDLMESGPGDQLRVSSAFVEINDRERGVAARLGRQSRGMAGVVGAFDGLLGGWQWRRNLGFSAAAGMPVDSTRDGLNTDRQFLGVAADFASPGSGWDTSVYALAQQYSGQIDRRSIGLEARYLRAGRTFMATADYDAHFGDLNNVMLIGTLVTASRWTFSADAARQRSPLLSIRNALIGQPTRDFDQLWLQFSAQEIAQLAQDRSAQLTQLGMSVAHPLGDRAQWTLNLLSTDYSGTPASGGVAEVPGLAREDSASSEIMFNGLFVAGDTNSLALRYQQGGSGNVVSAGFSSRIPMGDAFRITSRLRVDRRTQQSDSSNQWIYIPSLRIDYLRGRNSIELEGGAELNRRQLAGTREDTRRYFVSIGYRLSLQGSSQ